MKKEKFYITTSIPYVNAAPHIGHALEFVQADALARYYRLLGKNVFFLTGTDDNSLKNVQAAEEAGIATKKFVDQNAHLFLTLTKKFHLSNNGFIRTSEKQHFQAVQKLWQACLKDIYKKKYKGLYCLGCEEFKRKNELEGKRCAEHPNQKLEIIEEENYFFQLSKYQKELFKIIESNRYQIIPKERKNEALSFIRQGLEDFSISRSFKRAEGWGIPVPGDSSQIIYVWFDALANYLTGAGYSWNENFFQKYWPADLHIIGKGILKFHAIYWPAILLSAGISLPKQLFVHGYITAEGQKMSKSLGNIINPLDLIEKYGSCSLRYFLLSVISPFKDSDFSHTLFDEKYESDLADGLGNLVSRVLTMFKKYSKGKIPFCTKNSSRVLTKKIKIGGLDDFLEDIWYSYEKHFAEFSFDKILDKINLTVQMTNRYIDFAKPWKLFKEKKSELPFVLYNLGEILRHLSILIYPFMPQTSSLIRVQLGLKKIDENYFNFKEEIKWGKLEKGLKIQEKASLFPKIKFLF